MTLLGRRKRGMTLIDVVVVSGLILVVFLGFFGIFRASVVLVSSGKARAGAVALADERMEYIRSLPYDSVGTAGGIPQGALAQTEALSLNQTSYTRRTFIQYVDDPKDGQGGADQNGITADYKVAKVELSWTIKGMPRTYALVSNIVPKGVESLGSGGVLTIRALDALGAAVPSAAVRILNATGTSTVDVTAYTNSSGLISFPGTPPGSGYQITVGKSGYSTAKTYNADGTNTNPTPGHLSVATGQTTTATFSIDLLSTLTVRTWRAVASGSFLDSFTNAANVATSTDAEVAGGAVTLSSAAAGYPASGELYSVDITPSYLVSWTSFSWSSTTPATTQTLLRVYSRSGSTLVPIPDSLIPGNAAGLTTSPVSLSGVSSSTYPSLALGVALSTTDASTTPALLDWRVDYEGGPTPLPDIPFGLRGGKTIGATAGGAPIYKFSQDLATDGSSAFSSTTMEWDNYAISIDNAGLGYDFSEVCEPQPVSLLPGTTKIVDLTLSPHTANSLLVAVVNPSGALIPGASVRLYRGAFSAQKDGSSCGQSFFPGLSSGTVSGGNPYSLDVSAGGYQSATVSDIDVSGASTYTVALPAL